MTDAEFEKAKEAIRRMMEAYEKNQKKEAGK